VSPAAVAGALTDEALLNGFESATLTAGGFHHVEHVRVAWLYLQRFEPAAALARFDANIRRLAAAHGAPQRYHATITWAFLFLIRERFEPGESWEEFAARSGDLLAPANAVLGRYYSSELLAGDRARAGFLLPDRLAVPGGLPRSHEAEA
jgi:hypothetical protein